MENRTNGMAIAGLVLGIISIVFCWIPFVGIVAGVVGLILAVLGRKNCLPTQAGMATAGLVLSIVGLCISGIVTTCEMCAYCEAKENYDSYTRTYNSLFDY